MERFRATLGGDTGERPTVELPFDAKQRLGKARAPVRGTVDGAPFGGEASVEIEHLPDRVQPGAARASRHRDRPETAERRLGSATKGAS
jgi:hypothetical protein